MPVQQTALEDKYQLQYYTGSQASIWVGDIMVEEVFGIHFQATQNIVPIWGYASPFFDAVARGKVLIHGAFTINFIDEGYLYWILHKANADRAVINNDPANPSAKIINGPNDPPSDILRLMTIESSDTDRASSLAAILDTLVSSDIAGIDRLARDLTEIRSNKATNTNNIIYDTVPFNLMGVFGNPRLPKESITQKVIKNCFLVSNEMILAAEDEVVKERYSFIAEVHQ